MLQYINTFHITCRCIIPVLFFLVNIDGSYCQSKWVIKGEVDNFKDNKDDYFNVSLLSVKDSAFIDGGTFTNGVFNIELENIEEKQFILRINSVEYAVKDTVVYIEDSYTNVGNIYLKIKELNEITVTAKMPILTHKSGVMRLDIRNSFLQDAGNLVDILKKNSRIVC